MRDITILNAYSLLKVYCQQYFEEIQFHTHELDPALKFFF